MCNNLYLIEIFNGWRIQPAWHWHHIVDPWLHHSMVEKQKNEPLVHRRERSHGPITSHWALSLKGSTT